MASGAQYSSTIRSSVKKILSMDSYVFYVEQSSNDRSLSRPNTPIFFNSTEMSGNGTREMISILSIASLEPQIVTIDSNSIEPKMPYGFGRQLPIFPPSLNDLSLPPHPFNILATMAVVNPAEGSYDKKYSPQPPEPLEPSPISTPPVYVMKSLPPSCEVPTAFSILQDEKEVARWEGPFQKEGECRSTSAEHADK